MSIPKAKVDSTLPTILASKAFIDGTDSVAVFKANPDASSKNQVKYRTDPEKSPKMASSSSFQVQLTVTPTVLGGGGIWERKSWTSDSKRIRDEGLKIYAKQNKNASLTKDQEDVLTPWRCELYTCPKERPEALAEMLKIRLDHAQLFTKGFDLEGSLRIAGHTKKGATCLLAEVGSTRHSFNNYLNQAINILTLAADMSKPTSGGQAGFYCVNYMPAMSLKHFLNPASAFTMSSLLRSMWRNQLEGFLLVDMPPAFQWFLNLVLKVIPAETREKFKVMSYKESLVEIQKTCEPVLAGVPKVRGS